MRSQNIKNNYFKAVNDKTVPELQNELQRLKEKEKTYLKLNKKVKELQEKSKALKNATDLIGEEAHENQQIQRLKNQIQKTISDTKKIDEDNKVIKGQVKSLENQLRVLEEAYTSLCNENKLKRQKIQLKDEQLVEKQNQYENLVEQRNCNELVIQELRIELSKLQVEESDLRRQLQKIRMQRQQEQKQKQKLRDTVDDLKREIQEHQTTARDYKYRLSQVNQGNNIIKEQLITLINLEEKLKEELDKAIASYQNVTALQTKSRQKLKLLEDELQIAEEDVRLLTQQYIKQTQQLREEQLQNEKLNHEMDILAKEVLQVWDNVKQMMALSEQTQGELKIKAYKTWAQIAQILDIQ